MKLTDRVRKILKYIIFIAVPLALVIVVAFMAQQAAEKGDSMALKGTIPPIDTAAPAQTEMATFSLGWFWGADARFGRLDGVIRTRVGYAGGTSGHPTYYNLDGHTETVQIDYDPTRISYNELLDVFWGSHNPTATPYSQQYKSIIFYHDEAQRELAVQSKQQEEARLGRKIYTEITPYSEFYLAEDYHQKYYLQQVPELMADFKAIYPDTGKFINSTAAARINGYVGGYGTPETLQKELTSYGLSPTGNKKLLEYASAVSGICPLP